MKLACSSWSYHAAFKARRLDQRDWLRLCAEMDVDGVEFLDVHFPTTDLAYLRDLKRVCVDLQLTVAAVAVTSDFGDEDRRVAEIDRVRRWCEVAAFLGAPVVRVFAGGFPEQTSDPNAGRIVSVFRKVFGEPRADPRALWSDAMFALRTCADHAASLGVVLAVQNRSSGRSLVRDGAQLTRCVRDVGSPWLRACLDPAGLADAGSGIEPALADAVLVHARLRDVRDDGSDARAHWPAILRQLHGGRYRGFVSMDYEGPLEHPESAVPRAALHLRGLMRLLERQQLLTAPAADVSANGVLSDDVLPAESSLVEPEQPPVSS